MYYRINEVSTIVVTGNTFVHVDYWRTKAEYLAIPLPRRDEPGSGFLTNDFHMHLRPAQHNVREVVLDAIPAYWRRARRAGFSGDHTGDATKPLERNGQLVRQQGSTVPVRDTSDPNRVLERADIASLRGHKKEEPNL